MEKYKDWTVEDFLADKTFVSCCKDSSGKGEAFFKELADRYPAKRPMILEARQLIQSLTYPAQLSEMETQNIWRAIRSSQGVEEVTFDGERRVKRRYLSYAAAIALLIVAYLMFQLVNDQGKIPKQLADTKEVKDLNPGESKATLIMESGRVLDLQALAVGPIMEDKGLQLIKQNDGKLLYRIIGTGPHTAITHTLRTPRGGQYEVQLPDGSRIKLNSDAVLQYTLGAGSMRSVDLSGEAYFEVAGLKNNRGEKIPFRVGLSKRNASKEAKNVLIEVLGTHFNVKAYPEEMIKTSLLEGAVRISKGGQHRLLKPGEEAIINDRGEHIVVIPIENPEAVLAWTKGYFYFEKARLSTIMQQIGRWYNAEIIYENESLKRLEYSVYMISNKVPVSRLLQLMELTGNVHFKIESVTGKSKQGVLRTERRITVMP